MGILDSVERGLERAVNGAFARTFRSGVQPVEIASALKRELDIGAVVVDRDRVLAPNRFVVRVSEKDADRLYQLGSTLGQELRGVITKHAKRQSYQLLGEPDVEIRSDSSITVGVLEVDASRVEGAVDWVAAIDVDGTRHELSRGTTTVGRGSDCGIRISDNAASRKHLELIWDGTAGIARDLGSTNGSKINGQRFREAALSPGTVITIGQTGLQFQLVPGREAQTPQRPAPAAPTRVNPAARQEPPQPRPVPAADFPSAPPSAGAAPRISDSPDRGADRSAPRTSSPKPAQDAAPGIDEDFWRGL
ncbi:MULTISPECIES: FhaA domain-containing protein [Leucobacter]|uniref:FhaA domain-containing protein n=1 Tax=Leucobacter TaxID=55968 RepID=UPI003211C28A